MFRQLNWEYTIQYFLNRQNPSLILREIDTIILLMKLRKVDASRCLSSARIGTTESYAITMHCVAHMTA